MEAPQESSEKKPEVLDALLKLIDKNYKPKEGSTTFELTLKLTEDSYEKIFGILNKNVLMKVSPL